MKNHNYLRKVAWTQAEAGAALAERDAEEQRRRTRSRESVPEEPEPTGGGQASDEEHRAVLDMLKRFNRES